MAPGPQLQEIISPSPLPALFPFLLVESNSKEKMKYKYISTSPWMVRST